MVRYVVFGLAAFAGLYGLHRLALWAEGRGWIYYRKKHGRSGALSGAVLEIHSLLEPSKRHVLEESRRDRLEDEESGDPPASGEGGPRPAAR